VKRRSLRSRSTARKTPEARVLVVNVLGSRRRSDASRVARRGEPQGKPVARASPREVVTPLVRVATDRRRTGALESRSFNPKMRGGPFGRWACESCTQHQGSGHDGRHLGCRAAPSRGILSVGTRGDLGSKGEAIHADVRASGRSVVRVLLSGWSRQRRRPTGDEGCQRTVDAGQGSASRSCETARRVQNPGRLARVFTRPPCALAMRKWRRERP